MSLEIACWCVFLEAAIVRKRYLQVKLASGAVPFTQHFVVPKSPEKY